VLIGTAKWRIAAVASATVLFGSWPAAGATGQAVCKATHGYHCATSAGCVSDATYVSTYLIDWEKGTITQTSVQHTRRDPQPKADNTVYVIVKRDTSLSTGESTVTAVANIGIAATETILIGEKSYLSASVSSFGPRVFAMVGTCQGFRPQ
jgi:hypothetical protein